MRRYGLRSRRARQKGERRQTGQLAGSGLRNGGRALLATALGGGLAALAVVWSCAAPPKAREARAPGAEGGDSPAVADAERLPVPREDDRRSIVADGGEQSRQVDTASRQAPSEPTHRLSRDDGVARTVQEIKYALGNGLPLAGSWNVGKLSAGFHANWQVDTLIRQDGHLILPWFREPRRETTWEKSRDHFEAPMRFCAEHKLPISFRATQWENGLLEFADRPEAENPCLVSPDGKVEKVISPFGPPELWYRVGLEFNSDNETLDKLQEIYPDPPFVLIYSNNEPKIAKKVTPQNSKRLRQLCDRDPALDAADTEALRRVVEKAWEVRYKRLIQGLKDALTSATWKKNVRFIAYSGFNNRGSSSETILEWHKPHAWDGVSVHLYTSDWEVCRDFWVASPQGHAVNIDYAVNKVRTKYPDFFEELSIWYDNNPLVKITEYEYGQTYTPERYRGVVQFVLWTVRPQVLREYRGYRQTREEFGRSFHVVLSSVKRVHRHPVLRRFWLEGRLVQNVGAASRPPYAGPARWHILEADANRGVNWSDRTSQVNVYSLALVTGRPGDREWLLYAHAPVADRGGVTITVPEYGDVKVDAPVGGAFYHLKERGKTVASLSPIRLEPNIAPAARDDSYATGTGSVLETTNHRFKGVAGVFRNDRDADGDPLAASLVEGPRHGRLEFRPDGTFSYAPEKGFVGADRFTYRLTDGQAQSDPAIVKIEVKELARVIDDGDPGFSSVAYWRSLKGKDGYQKDFAFHPGDPKLRASSTASWTFADLPRGEYEVYATWPLFSYKRPRKVPFEVFDGERSLGVVNVNQDAPPKGPKARGQPWQKLGAYTISSGTLKVVLSNAAKGRWVVADAVRVVKNGPVGTTAGSARPGTDRIIDNGDPGYEETARWMAGMAGHGGDCVYVRGVDKPGEEERLAEAVWEMRGLEPGVYEVFATWAASTSRTVIPYHVYDGTTLKAKRPADQTAPPNDLFARGSWWESLGTYVVRSGTLRLRINNHADKKKIVADAVAIAASEPLTDRILDDGAPGFGEKRRGEPLKTGYNAGSRRYNNEGESEHVATWRAADLTPGRYRVLVTWRWSNFNCAEVPYRVLDGTREVGQVVIDQTRLPDDEEFDGAAWEELGTYEVTGGTLEVRLHTAPGRGKVVADAVRIVPVSGGAR